MPVSSVAKQLGKRQDEELKMKSEKTPVHMNAGLKQRTMERRAGEETACGRRAEWKADAARQGLKRGSVGAVI
jgi:hypothetical protein